MSGPPIYHSPDVASLADRMGFLQALRAALALIVLGSAFLASQVVAATVADVILVSAAYLLLSGLVEALRRVERGRALWVITGMLLVDGVYLAWAMYVTGGTQSPLRFLPYVHLIAVTLLASYRTGLKITLWHSLLYFVVFYAQAAGVLEVTEAPGLLPGTGPAFQRVSFMNVMALWLVAIATAVFSAANERELRRRRLDLEALTEMAASLEEVARPGDVAERLLQTVCDNFGFSRGVVLGGASGDLSLLAAVGSIGADSERGGRDAIVDAASNEREIKLVKRVEPRANPRLAALLPDATNVVVAPLVAEGHPVGVLAVEHPRRFGARIERRVVTMVGQFAAHAALALRNAWLLEQIQKMAETDALTGLANRRVFEATLDRELSRAARNGEPLSLMMVDIDRFKTLNDTYGHQTGDEILKLVAKTLRERSRDFDTAARYGGEEFAVILPSCSAQESLVVAERLRKQIADLQGPVPVTASAGVATFPIHATRAENLIKAADEALYESKRAGRNRVTASTRNTTESPVEAVSE